MGVVYIGDRNTGKTALATELINPKHNFVKVSGQSYLLLKNILTDPVTGNFKPTDIDPNDVDVSINRSLEVEVNLPAGTRSVDVDWIDTPGEVWKQSWQTANPDRWEKVLTHVQKSEGIMLILPPYREMPGLKPERGTDFPTQQQWYNRFYRWVEFFRYECPKARHILICLNRADLFCNVQQEATTLTYQPYGTQMGWYERNAYVTRKYFRPIASQLTEINHQTNGIPIRCFITSIYNRTLLELPWIYLASYLAN